MEIYLDDCSDDDDLDVFLSRAGHTVFTPRSEGTSGAPDPRHLAHAASRNYVLLTQNPIDFQMALIHLALIHHLQAIAGTDYW